MYIMFITIFIALLKLLSLPKYARKLIYYQLSEPSENVAHREQEMYFKKLPNCRFIFVSHSRHDITCENGFLFQIT